MHHDLMFVCAVAYSGKKLGVKTTVVVPETTPAPMKEKILKEGTANVQHTPPIINYFCLRKLSTLFFCS